MKTAPVNPFCDDRPAERAALEGVISIVAAIMAVYVYLRVMAPHLDFDRLPEYDRQQQETTHEEK